MLGAIGLQFWRFQSPDDTLLDLEGPPSVTPPRADEQLPNPSGRITLFELDATNIGGPLLRFVSDKAITGESIVWQGQVYTAWPIEAAGFEWNGAGQMPRPTIRVANVTAAISALCLTYSDLVGAKLSRKMTLAKYLDAVNFPGGVNPTADPNAAYADEIYFVDRKIIGNRNVVEFETTSNFDVQGVRLPRRPIIQNICPFEYRKAECGYAGPPVAKEDDTPTTSAALDVCGKRVGSCKLRFGANGELPFGGFPSVGLVR